jgi:redox-sensitive bicupin YhaK (pirin superfamily)
MLGGQVEHGDSLGNRGVIGAGDVQWMTAGSGIIHQEMPAGDPEGLMGGFQLWANLPAARKMCDPVYRGVEECDIPEISHGDATVRVICGGIAGVEGPVHDVVVEPRYLDVSLPPGGTTDIDTETGHTVFAYVVQGSVAFGDDSASDASDGLHEHDLAIFGEGEDVRGRAAGDGARFLLVSGKPIGAPIAWGGPIVMNTNDELREAFREYREGTFVKTHDPVMDW